MLTVELLVLFIWTGVCTCLQVTKPNVIFILADDLGFNDVGFHGSNQIPTPNIDALAYSGIILNNYYVTPLCTPSRSALMTGKYPIHTGMQHEVIYGDQPWGLPLSETLLPQYLQEAGFVTRFVGKWHLGHFKEKYLPETRGFDSHYGYWVGHQDYFDHTSQENVRYWGYDMRRGMNITWSDYGHYTTRLFTKEAVAIIKDHDQKDPLFLYIAHLATHSANPYEPLQAPLETINKFNNIDDRNRRLFAGMLSELDDSVGEVVQALSVAGMLENSIIVFSTDNGGPAAGFNSNAASNWPLRGVKDTLWQGGVRGTGLIWSPLLPASVISNQYIHITDWLPTLLSGVGVKNVTYKGIDGIDMWNSLSTQSKSPRNEVLLNIDTKRKFAGLIRGVWKYIKGGTWNGTWDGWYGPSGRDEKYIYNFTKLYNSPAAVSITKIRSLPNVKMIQDIRIAASVNCNQERLSNEVQGNKEDVYLFNLLTDPCELSNLAPTMKNKVKEMENAVAVFMKSMIPQRNKPADPRSNPKYWGYAWINWMDFLD